MEAVEIHYCFLLVHVLSFDHGRQSHLPPPRELSELVFSLLVIRILIILVCLCFYLSLVPKLTCTVLFGIFASSDTCFAMISIHLLGFPTFYLRIRHRPRSLQRL